MDVIIISIGALITALGGAVASITLGVKNLAEARQTREHAAVAAHEVTHNSGSSMKDSLARVEQSQLAVAGAVDEIRDEISQLRKEKAIDHQDIRHRLRRLERPRWAWPWPR